MLAGYLDFIRPLEKQDQLFLNATHRKTREIEMAIKKPPCRKTKRLSAWSHF